MFVHEILRFFGVFLIVYACLFAPFVIQIFRTDPCIDGNTDDKGYFPLIIWGYVISLLFPVLFISYAFWEIVLTTKVWCAGASSSKDPTPTRSRRRWLYFIALLCGAVFLGMGLTGLIKFQQGPCRHASLSTVLGIPSDTTHVRIPIPASGRFIDGIGALMGASFDLGGVLDNTNDPAAVINNNIDGNMNGPSSSVTLFPPNNVQINSNDAPSPRMRRAAPTTPSLPQLPEGTVPTSISIPLPPRAQRFLFVVMGFPLFRLLYLPYMLVPIIIGGSWMLWALWGLFMMRSRPTQQKTFADHYEEEAPPHSATFALLKRN